MVELAAEPAALTCFRLHGHEHPGRRFGTFRFFVSGLGRIVANLTQGLRQAARMPQLLPGGDSAAANFL
jgi:hypothetical protein